MVIANSNVIHRLYSPTGIHFHCLILDDLFCSENGLHSEEICFEKIIVDEQARHHFENVIECTEAYEEKKTPLSTMAFRSAVLTLLVYLCAHHSAPVEEKKDKTPSSEEYVKRVLKYINENFARPITLDTLAALCGITKFHLVRQFKRYTGQTIFSYLNHLRCKKAELLIAEGNSITEAAYASGFESLSYFSRTYKKNMGTAPSKKVEF
jgi:AraC-like DNA-binding protein